MLLCMPAGSLYFVQQAVPCRQKSDIRRSTTGVTSSTHIGSVVCSFGVFHKGINKMGIVLESLEARKPRELPSLREVPGSGKINRSTLQVTRNSDSETDFLRQKLRHKTVEYQIQTLWSILGLETGMPQSGFALRDSNPCSTKRFLSSPKRPDRLWSQPTSYYSNGGQSGRGVKLTTVHSVPRVRTK